MPGHDPEPHVGPDEGRRGRFDTRNLDWSDIEATRSRKELIMKYVDGFVIPVAKRNLPAYLKMARLGAKVWREHGALEYRECVGDDLRIKGMPTSFPAKLKLKPSETLVFAWIVYKSRAHRDRVNAKVMKDPRMNSFAPKSMPFDVNAMLMGGFKVIVDR